MLTKLVRELASELVLARASDPSSLESARTILTGIIEWSAEHSAEVHGLAAPVAPLLEEAIGGTSEDPEAALARLGDLVEKLEELAEGGSDVAAEPAPAGGGELDPILADFIASQGDNLDEVEALILDATRDEPDPDAMRELRGRLHTLKGEAGVLDLGDVSSLCHALEDVLDDNPAIVLGNVLLAAVDWLRKRLEGEARGEQIAPFDVAAQLDGTADEAAEPSPSEPREEEPAAPAAAAAPASSGPAVEIGPHPLTSDPLMADFVSEATEHLEEVDAQLLALDSNPSDMEAVNTVFRAFHTIKGVAGFLELPVIQHVAHVAETMLDKVRSGTLCLQGEAMNLTFDANDTLKKMVTTVEEGLGGSGTFVPPPSVPELLERLDGVIHGRSSPVAAATPAPEPAPAATPAAASDGGGAPDGPRGGSSSPVRETIKVDASRLDSLVDMIGELVIAEAMVTECDELDLTLGTRLTSLLGHMDKITRELQEMAMSLRMIPIGSTFRRMARLARDVSNRLGKKIEFVTKGDETELDKTVVDAIGDPLVHMVRNAIDHGLEKSAEDRIEAGKPEKGLVILRAFHQGGSIHIEIEDDGQGMDRDRILAKARESGIVQDDEQLSDNEIYNLIFAPGFSTAKEVTDVSGRGVGLDVVKRNIEALRGRVEIRSTPGVGSTFSIRLPLTLAIIDGMVVSVGDERYVLPTASIVRMIRPDAENLSSVFERHELLRIGDELVSMTWLADLFDVPGGATRLEETSAVVVEHDDRRHAFLVDQLLGQQQIVIKPLGPPLSGMRGVAGGAIMPDGQVGLILDIAGLVSVVNVDQERSGESRRQRMAIA